MPLILSGDTGPSFVQSAAMPAGSVIQTVSAVKTDTFSVVSTTWTDLTGLSVAITPTSSSNKILVNVSLCFQGDAATQGYAQLVRNSTAIAIGDANGSRVRFTLNQYVNQVNEARTLSFMFLDSPATTSSITYKIQLQNQNNSGTIFVNRSTTWANDATSGTGISTITAMEIKV